MHNYSGLPLDSLEPMPAGAVVKDDEIVLDGEAVIYTVLDTASEQHLTRLLVHTPINRKDWTITLESSHTVWRVKRA